MPKCYICERELPVTNFYLVRDYQDSYGEYWYICKKRDIDSGLILECFREFLLKIEANVRRR